MQPFWADSAGHPPSIQVHTATPSPADGICANAIRLSAYVGTLALIGILAIHLWNNLPKFEPQPGWTLASGTAPAFVLDLRDYSVTSAAYTVLRNPEGGRKDILYFTGRGNKPLAELEIYRLGREFDPASAIGASLVRRMPLSRFAALEPAGLVESKFGMVALIRPGGGGAESCLGFFKGIGPALQVTGWSCRGDSPAARRTAVTCLLDRLTLRSLSHKPRIAALFPAAELEETGCSGFAPSAGWMTGAQFPKLRGML
jgi:hypothetical protein